MGRVLAGAAIAALLVLYFAGQQHNPPGFDFDESSIAYNALTIARHGVDEHGVAFPLYFRSFGEYKNPTYIYALSGVFRVFGPGTLTARRFSALLGVGAAVALGWLAWKVTRRKAATVLTVALAALTPMLFEITRLAFEVAMFPLVVVLFLIAARNAYEQARWRPRLIAALVVTLALVTYTYTAGRLLGPVFAVLLALFLMRERRWPLAAVWVLYGLTLVPMFALNARADGALFQRPGVVVEGQSAFVRNYIANLNPIPMALRGDPNALHHIPRSGGSILLVTPLLVAIGLARTFRDRWTWFLIAGGLAAVAPAALTVNVHHSLRLAGYFVFLIALSIPAFVRPRAIVLAAVLAGVVQATFFFVVFHRDGGRTRHFEFHHGAREVIDDALAQTPRPIYMNPSPGYIHAYWFGALRGVDRDTFAFVPRGQNPPHGSIMLAGMYPPENGIPIGRHGRYGAYFVP